MTGVSTVVMSDISSSYNTIKTVSDYPEYNDLCGFTTDELRGILDRVADECGLSPEQADDPLIYNPTLALYFLEELARYCEYPARILDSNLAMDRNRIHFVAGLPHGERLVTQALATNETNPEENIFIDRLADRFGVEDMLNTPETIPSWPRCSITWGCSPWPDATSKADCA